MAPKKYKILQYDFGQDVKVTETYGRVTVYCGYYCEWDESLQIIKNSTAGACM
jgi:formylmethanofuran dehydrogenase subunit D